MPLLNEKWCVTMHEAAQLFGPGQLRAGWSRKRRRKFLKHFRQHKFPRRCRAYCQIMDVNYEFVCRGEEHPTTVFYRPANENP